MNFSTARRLRANLGMDIGRLEYGVRASKQWEKKAM